MFSCEYNSEYSTLIAYARLCSLGNAIIDRYFEKLCHAYAKLSGNRKF